MLEDDFFARFAALFQDVAGTLVDAVDTISATVDPDIAPAPFLPWLGTWIGDTGVPGDTDLRQREWLRCQARALAWRGTRFGLELILRELCGGGPVRVDDGGGVYAAGGCPSGDPSWVRVEVPDTGGLAPSDLARLVRDEVPAQVRVELLVGGVPVLGPGPDLAADSGEGP
jgi:phage tail-like protein